MHNKLKVLFLCTGNSCRSQIAEGWARALKDDVIEPYSAGVEVHGLNAKAVMAMAEAGVHIEAQRSKHVAELSDISFDVVVTVCDNAREACPVYPQKVRLIHHSFTDPAQFEVPDAPDEEILKAFRDVRDEIRVFVEGMPENLLKGDR